MKQLSDRKYKSMMRMIDVALPKFDDDDAETSRPGPTVRQLSTFGQSSRRKIDDETEYHTEPNEADSDDEDVDGEVEGENSKDEFFDTEDMADGVRSPSPYPRRSPLTRHGTHRKRTFTRRRSSSPSRSTASRRPSSAPRSTRPSRIGCSSTPCSRASSSSSASVRST